MGYLDKFRQKVDEKMKASGAAGKELSPQVGKKYTVRLLPQPNVDEIPYHTHSYHFIPAYGDVKGKYWFTRKKYIVNGKSMKDPMDVVVNNLFKEAEKLGDKSLGQHAAKIKRKRMYFMNCFFLNEETKQWEFKFLKDSSADGRLFAVISKVMGVPFLKDVEDNWIEKTSKNIDPSRPTFDLIDFESGCDFRICKDNTSRTFVADDGSTKNDTTFDNSFAIAARPLTPEQIDMWKKNAVDLAGYISYEEDYDTVQKAIDDYMSYLAETVFKSPSVDSAAITQAINPQTRPVPPTINVNVTENENSDGLSALLEDIKTQKTA